MVRVVNKVKLWIIRNRLNVITIYHLLLTAFGFAIALGLRFDFDAKLTFDFYCFTLPLPVLLVSRLSAYMYWNLNRGYWRYVSVHDVVSLTKAHLVSTLFFTAILGLWRMPGFPRSVIFIELILSLMLAAGSRLIVRLLCEHFLSDSKLDDDLGGERQVLILGGGDSGHLLIKTLRSARRLPYIPVGVLDDGERLQRSNVYGVPVVGGLPDLRRVLQSQSGISAVISAIPSIAPAKLQEIQDICKEAGVLFKRLQSFEDIACLDGLQSPEAPSIERLLEREIKIEHEDDIRHALIDKCVLVTGGGGSIGSEIVRQVLAFKPSQVVLVDQSEFNLFEIERELASLSLGVKTRIYVADICDEERLLRIFADTSPQVVFHAAAYKHVPLMESNCYEAFCNNVLGTRTLLKVSNQYNVERIVLISTDKAVDPSSVMGCSKRMAELLMLEYLQRQSGIVSASAVRFGNVINSAGSVVPLFKRQIVEGGPVTVTHPEMKRYFMSVREAVRLVLTAGILGGRGDVYVLDMGQPIKIVDVAKKMLALYGRRDINIVFTGIRPGEKLSEELVTDREILSSTRFAKVRKLESSLQKVDGVIAWVTEFERSLAKLSDQQIANEMHAFILSYGSNGSNKITEVVKVA